MTTPGEDATARESGPQPLRGIRVLEFAQNLAGPWCGQILADLGADVIKIEPPGAGDAARAWGPPFIGADGAIFAAANRNKRSITLDLRSGDARAIVADLAGRADILIEALRPGVFAHLGYDPETVWRWNPRLLYCSVLAYGASGPLRELPGYDPLMQAHGGIMSITGHPETGPARVGTSIVDMGTGMWLTIAILAALRERDDTGRGSHISVSLYDTALAWNGYHLLGLAAGGTAPGPMGTELPMIAPYGSFPVCDGRIMIAAANDALFRRLCAALSLGDAVRDPRFATNPLRVEHRTEINGIVAAATSSFTRHELLHVLRDAGVPCAPILGLGEVLEDPQTAASGMIVEGPALRLPVRFDGVRPAATGTVPRAGEHTQEIPGG